MNNRGHRDRTINMPARCLLLGAAMACAAAAAWAAPQTTLPGGIFLEAENYARIVHGEEGFALVEGQSGASGGRIIQNLGADGLVLYEPRVPKAGSYALWARAATTATATALYGFGADDSRLEKATLAMTASKASAANAFQWRRLGAVDLPPGPARMLIGRTPARYDCFFLAADAGARVTDAVLHEARRAGEATIGEPLPELRHDRAVTRHPEWLTQRALRPAYGHLEWDPKNTPQSWARMAKESGANCLIGVGEMPAGTFQGKMRIFSFQMIDEPGWSYPKGYQRHDHSWVREFVEAGHAEGLKVVMYDGSWRTLDPLLVEHPEWRQKSVNGAPYRRGFGSWHSPYRQAYIDRWVKVAREHGIDGIMVDMLFTGPAGGDYSPYTVEAFRKRFGVEPPRVRNPRDLAWQRWIDFQTWTREEVMLDVTEALHAVNPEIACIWNQTAGWSFTGQEFLGSRAGRCGDGLLEEMGLELTHSAFEKRPFAWPLQSAWQSLYLRCRSAYGQMYHLNGFYTRANHLALSLSMFANGIAPAVVTGGNWEHLREVWAHIRACEPHMAGAALEPWAALHFSERTLDRYGGGSDEARRAYLNNVFGLFQALLELHLPVTIVTDDDLEDAAALRRHAVLILGNSACLGDRQAQTIDAYVRAGGGLVATFETGVCDENGARREQPALREILGVRQGDPHKPGVWLLPTSTLEHEALRVPELLGAGDSKQGNRDRMASVAIFDGGRARTAQILQTVPGGDVASVPMFLERDRKGNCKPVGFYALHTRAAGKGRVAFLPPDIGQGYFTYNHPVTRTLLDRVARWAAPTPPVLETGAPLAVQTVCYRKGGSLVVHLVNDNSSYGRGSPPGPENFGAFRDEILPVRDLRVAVRGEFKKATLLPAGKALNVSFRDLWRRVVGSAGSGPAGEALKVSFREGMSEVVVPEVGVHAMVVFE